MAWKTKKSIVINTPKGEYTPQSDDLVTELVEAAKFANLEAFNVRIDGKYYNEDELPTKSVSALIQPITVEGVEQVFEKVEVEPRDTAGTN